MDSDPEIRFVLDKLSWMRANKIWPNGLRYLWTDAFGVVLLVSLYEALEEPDYLTQAEELVREVDRVLGRDRGIRIGEEADRGGQYFHYLAMWLYSLAVLARHIPEYREKGVDLVHEIHAPFLLPGRGIFWKMLEDLSAPYPGYGLGALDAFDGYISYRMLDEKALAPEISDMKKLIDKTFTGLVITQDLGLGMMLWLCHFFPDEDWALFQKKRCLKILEFLWHDEGYFCREPNLPNTRFGFTNYGISVGLQSVGAMDECVQKLNTYFDSYRSGDEYDFAAISHVMACNSHFPGRLLSL